MISPEQVPDEVVKAALITDERLGMRTVIAAALNAWPNGYTTENREAWSAELILPLTTQENENG